MTARGDVDRAPWRPKSSWQSLWPFKTRAHSALRPWLTSTSVQLLGSGTCARETWAAQGSRCARPLCTTGRVEQPIGATVHRSATRVWCPLQVFKFSLYLAVPACLTAAVVLRQDVLQAIIKSVSLL